MGNPTGDPNLAAEGQTAPQINHLERLIGVFFSPGPTFAKIVAAPSWILPMVLLVVLSAISVTVLNQRMDWRSYVSQQIDKSSGGADLSADQKEQRVAGGAKMAPIFAYVFGVPAVAIVIVVVAALMLVAYNLLAGANVNFATSMAIVSHAFLVTILSTAIFLLVVMLKPYGTIDLDNPVATNLGALVPEDAPKWLLKLGISFDVFTFWILILMAIGFAAANPKKLPFTKALGIGFACWALFVIVRVCAAWIFS